MVSSTTAGPHSKGASYNRHVTGLILFAHGARDPRWAEPFERLKRKVEAARPGMPVALAYLEIMEPDLMGATDALISAGTLRSTGGRFPKLEVS